MPYPMTDSQRNSIRSAVAKCSYYDEGDCTAIHSGGGGNDCPQLLMDSLSCTHLINKELLVRDPQLYSEITRHKIYCTPTPAQARKVAKVARSCCNYALDICSAKYLGKTFPCKQILFPNAITCSWLWGILPPELKSELSGESRIGKDVVCPVCGKTFFNSGRLKYCSPGCRAKALREQKKLFMRRQRAVNG